MPGWIVVVWDICITALRGASFLVGLVIFCFALSYMAPGDTARSILGANALESEVVQLRQEMGWDQPLSNQMANYAEGLLQFDLGHSHHTGQPVLDEITQHFRYTVSIGGIAILISMFLALGINWLLLYYKKLAPIIPVLRTGVSAPSFLIALTAALATGTLFSFLGMGHYSGSELSILALLGPALAIAVYPAALMTALLRNRYISISKGSYYRAAIALGYNPTQLFLRVILPNSAGILLAAWINQISTIVFSTILVEQFFSIPGGGSLLVSAIQTKDLPIISGVVLLNGVFFLVVNTLGMRFADRLAHGGRWPARMSNT